MPNTPPQRILLPCPDHNHEGEVATTLVPSAPPTSLLGLGLFLLLPSRLCLLLVGLVLKLVLEEGVDGVPPHRGEHVLKQLVPLLLVLLKGVDLLVGPEADKLLEVVHILEVLLPEIVHLGEREVPLDLKRKVVLDGVQPPLLAKQALPRLRLQVGHLGGVVPLREGRLVQLDALEELLDLGHQALEVGVRLTQVVWRNLPHRLEAVLLQAVAHVVLVGQHEVPPQRVERLPLRRHNLVVLEHLLADPVEVLLHALLHLVQRVGHALGLERHVLLHPQRLEQPVDRVAPKHPEDGVVEREEEARAPRVPLAPGPPAQLRVDAAALVPLRPDDVEAPQVHDVLLLAGALLVKLGLCRLVRLADSHKVRAVLEGAALGRLREHRLHLQHVGTAAHLGLGVGGRLLDQLLGALRQIGEGHARWVGLDFHPVLGGQPVLLGDEGGGQLLHHLLLGEETGVSPQKDVRAAPSHVGRDGDGKGPAGLRDDLALPVNVLGLGVEQLVGNLELVEELVELLRRLDARGPDEDGLALGVPARNVAHDRLPLALLRAERDVGVVAAGDGEGRGDADDAQVVNVLELGSLGGGRARHSRELGELAEE
mmetsp:Transcript_26866/g.62214  ORF Transcript_26866/g.62214 Transcript_26866/m.62214 type:complete len:596 (-) Transcript_26866:1355-3142(-)